MKFLSNYSLVSLLALASLFSGCGNSNGSSDQPSQPAGPVGSIRGSVRLKGDAPKAATDAISQDQKTCGDSVSLPRIALGKDNGVQSTFVFLEGVPETGRARPVAPKEPFLIDQKDCQYIPHALIVPLGSKVEISNSDPILHNVHGTQSGEGVFNYAQAKQGLRQEVDMKTTKAGIVTLTCEAGHPWMNAFVYLAKDPFVALTDANGEFVIKDVPPGTYTLKMWHEGVTLKKIYKNLQLYEYEEPYELSQQVTVAENGEASVNFEMELRK
jgi:plastocyanin